MDLEVLSVEESKNNKDSWEVLDIVGLNTFAAKNSTHILKASQNSLYLIREYLNKGLSVYISKNITGTEVIPSDIIINDAGDLECEKNIALRIINNQITENALGIDIIDAMDYLNCYMKLLAAGIFITDKNREDKYFEIIEAAQENEMPAELLSDATFEQEQEYIKKKNLYDQSQDNLNTLEKYLNAYDRLSKVSFTNTFLNEIKESISSAESIEEVNSAVEKYKQQIKQYQT